MDNKEMNFETWLRQKDSQISSITEYDPIMKKKVDEFGEICTFFTEHLKDRYLECTYIFLILYCIACGNDDKCFQNNIIKNKKLSKRFRSYLKREYEQTPKWAIEYLYHFLDDIGDDKQCD